MVVRKVEICWGRKANDHQLEDKGTGKSWKWKVSLGRVEVRKGSSLSSGFVRSFLERIRGRKEGKEKKMMVVARQKVAKTSKRVFGSYKEVRRKG